MSTPFGPTLKAWYKADAGCYTDANFNTPCTDGSPCGGVYDQSGNGFFLTTRTAGHSPTWRANQISGLPGIIFGADGNVGLTTTSPPLTTNGPPFYCMAFTPYSTPYLANAVCSDSLGYNSVSFGQNSNVLVCYGTQPATAGPLAIGVFHYGAVQMGGAGFGFMDSFYMDNPVDTGTRVMTNLIVGNAGAYAYSLPMMLAEFAVLDTQGLSLAILESIIPYFQSRYGIPNAIAQSNKLSRPESIGFLRGINTGGPTSILGDSPNGRDFQIGVLESKTVGNPTPPCLELAIPGMWRFQLYLTAGPHSIAITALQVQPTPGARPSMVIKANAAMGLNFDSSSSAPAASIWQTIGPIAVNPTSSGMVWIELWNNYYGAYNTPAYFDSNFQVWTNGVPSIVPGGTLIPAVGAQGFWQRRVSARQPHDRIP